MEFRKRDFYCRGETVSHTPGNPCVMTSADPFSVRVCGCGTVQLCFGATLINLTLEKALAVTRTLEEATEAALRRNRLPEAVPEGEATIDPSGNVVYGKFPT